MTNYLEQQPQLGNNIYIAPTATVIGAVQIGDDSSVWPSAVIRGDVGPITVGARVSVQDNATLHVTHASEYNPEGFALSIGDDVTIGHGAILHGCRVGSRCLIGIGAIILDGAIIDSDAMIAAGALVPPGKHVQSGELWVGNPAKMTRKLNAKEIEFLRYSAAHYVKVKNSYINQS